MAGSYLAYWGAGTWTLFFEMGREYAEWWINLLFVLCHLRFKVTRWLGFSFSSYSFLKRPQNSSFSLSHLIHHDRCFLSIILILLEVWLCDASRSVTSKQQILDPSQPAYLHNYALFYWWAEDLVSIVERCLPVSFWIECCKNFSFN